MKIRIWDNTPDKAGDRIRVETIDLSRFNQNPLLLHMHGAESVPVGMVKNLIIEDSVLFGELVFDTEDPHAAMLQGKYERGFMRGISPRFFAYGERETREGNTLIKDYDRAELVEISLVTLPSHKNAVSLHKNLDGDLPEGAKDLHPFRQVDLKKGLNDKPKNKPNLKMKDLFKKLSLGDEATEAQAIEKVNDLQKQLADKDAETAAEIQKVKDLQKKLNDQATEALVKEIDTVVDAAVAQKRILPTAADEYKELAKMEGGLERVRKILNSATPAKSISSELEKGGNAVLLKKLSDRAEWDYMKWFKEDPAGLEALKTDAPDAFTELSKNLKAN